MGCYLKATEAKILVEVDSILKFVGITLLCFFLRFWCVTNKNNNGEGVLKIILFCFYEHFSRTHWDQRYPQKGCSYCGVLPMLWSGKCVIAIRRGSLLLAYPHNGQLPARKYALKRLPKEWCPYILFMQFTSCPCMHKFGRNMDLYCTSAAQCGPGEAI